MAGPGAGLRVSAAPRETDGAAGREEFFLRTSRPGRYTLEGRMIGYGTVETEPFRLGPGQTVNRRIEMGVEAIALEGIDARVGARCEPHPDATEEGQRLWDQVKTALAAVALTDGAVRIRLLARTFERDIDVHRGIVRREVVDTAEIIRSQPFRSLSVYTLLRRGFRESVGEVLAVEGIGTFRLVPEPLGTVQGRLVSLTGVPITGALVYLSGTEYADSTDADGRFRLAGVREGRYVLSWHREDLTDALGPAALREVSVAADTVREVTWRVIGADGLLEPPRFEHAIPPVPTAKVRAQPPGGLSSLVSSPGSRSTRRR